jgi:hypothetical protein
MIIALRNETSVFPAVGCSHQWRLIGLITVATFNRNYELENQNNLLNFVFGINNLKLLRVRNQSFPFIKFVYSFCHPLYPPYAADVPLAHPHKLATPLMAIRRKARYRFRPVHVLLFDIL